MHAWTPLQIREFMCRTELLRGVPPDAVDRLAGHAAVRVLAAGDAVVRQGDFGRSLFVIASGSVSISHEGEEADQPVSVLGPGNFFGELSLMTGAARSATVTANGEVVLIELPAEVVLELSREFLDLRIRLGRVGVTRSRDTLARERGARPTEPEPRPPPGS